MPKALDLTGQRFGKLVALEPSERGKKGEIKWLCRCDCGNKVLVGAHSLTSGNTKSCGCLKHRKWAEDLTGQRFGKLTVLERSDKYDNQKTHWVCKCDCGNITIVPGNSLKTGNTTTCGCSHITQNRFGKTRLYEVWFAMISRCTKQENKSYQDYGGRGIQVCEAWKTFLKFKEWADATGYDENAPRGECTLDRVNVDGDYCPENCRWVDVKTQANNKRNNVMLTYNNETKSIGDWARQLNVPHKMLSSRYLHGWSVEDILTKPSMAPKNTLYQLTCNGETKSVTEWSKISGLSVDTIRRRVKSGWTPEEAVSLPLGSKRRSV